MDIKGEKNCQYMGVTPYENVPSLMNQYEHFIWLPPDGHFDSFGRTAIEALLSGMKLIIKKETMGAFSWKWNFDDPQEVGENLRSYYNRFWENIFKFF